jgi:cytoskeletal protein CcmA (bactofilin family)
MADTPVMKSPSDDNEVLTETEAVSVIGETLHFKGELSASEDLVIEGTVEGTINQGKCCLTVKPEGQIIATVNATRIFIEGKVKGDLFATVSVTVRESGVVDGNIVAPRVAITEGATFNGNIRMQDPTDSADG